MYIYGIYIYGIYHIPCMYISIYICTYTVYGIYTYHYDSRRVEKLKYYMEQENSLEKQLRKRSTKKSKRELES